MFVCDGIGRSANRTALSGYVSSDPPNSKTFSFRTQCKAVIENLPPNTTLRFDAIDFLSQPNGPAVYSVTIGDSGMAVQRDDVVLRTSDSNGQITVQTRSVGNRDNSDVIRFNYRYEGELINSYVWD